MKYPEFTSLVDVPQHDDDRRAPAFWAADLRALRVVVNDERLVTIAEILAECDGEMKLAMVPVLERMGFYHVGSSGEGTVWFGYYDWRIEVRPKDFAGFFPVGRSTVSKIANAQADERSPFWDVRFDGLTPAGYLRSLFTDAATDTIREIEQAQDLAWWNHEHPQDAERYEREVDGYLGKSTLAKLREISFGEEE